MTVVQVLPLGDTSARVDRAGWERFVARVHATRPGLVMEPVTCLEWVGGWWVVLEVGRRTRWISGDTPEDAADELLRRMRA